MLKIISNVRGFHHRAQLLANYIVKANRFTTAPPSQTIADVIRTCLGPRAMLKMLMDPMGGIVMTNDGNAILREITVQHPAAKSLIEIARTQDEEVRGDGGLDLFGMCTYYRIPYSAYSILL